MGFDIEFILALGKTLSLLFVIIFVEGVISGRPDGKWPGLVFASFIAAVSIVVGLVTRSYQYFLIMMVPTALCFLVYYVSRRNVAKGRGYHPDEDES